MKTAFSIASLAVLVLVTGCGSFASRWTGERGSYSGVRYDVHRVTGANNEGEQVVVPLDIPISAVVDTLLLPYDLAVEK